MKNLIFLMAAILWLSSCCAPPDEKRDKADLKKLVLFMEGSFSSEEQAKSDTNYHHITLDMKHIWKNQPDGAWLYVEQTAAWTPGKPYRQRVYHLQQLSDSTFSSTIYKLNNPDKYIGAHLDPTALDFITPDSLALLDGCGLHLVYSKNEFIGETEEGECLNTWGEATYATSEVQISQDMLYSWDRGWNKESEQVWGAENGGYKFARLQKVK